MSRTNDEEYRLPCAEAILAGTLALMTGHAQSRCDVQRHCMARKISSNLDKLAEHPDLSSQFRMALANLTSHWRVLMNQGSGAAPGAPGRQLWHASGSSIH